MKSIYLVLFGILGGLLGAGLIWMVASQPRGSPVSLRPPPTAAPILVHVAGAVATPGVYPLPEGSRVRDALDSAGGLLEDADVPALNLAAGLEDGDQLWIPAVTDRQIPEPGGPPVPGVTSSAQEPALLIDINRAAQDELESLPGIGPATAEKIISYREKSGPFTSIEEIMNVSGIGPATFERIQGLITVLSVINPR